MICDYDLLQQSEPWELGKTPTNLSWWLIMWIEIWPQDWYIWLHKWQVNCYFGKGKHIRKVRPESKECSLKRLLFTCLSNGYNKEQFSENKDTFRCNLFILTITNKEFALINQMYKSNIYLIKSFHNLWNIQILYSQLQHISII